MGYVYSSDFISDDKAPAGVMQLSAAALDEQQARVLRCHRPQASVLAAQLPGLGPGRRLYRAVGSHRHSFNYPWVGFFLRFYPHKQCDQTSRDL